MIASIEVRKERMAICKACPHVTVIARTNTHKCSLCGCPLASKTLFQRASCPAGKWQPTRSNP